MEVPTLEQECLEAVEDVVPFDLLPSKCILLKALFS